VLPDLNFVGGPIIFKLNNFWIIWLPLPLIKTWYFYGILKGKKCFKKEKQYEKKQKKKYGKEEFDFTLSQWNAALNCNINGCLIAGNLNCSAMKKKWS